MNKLLTWWRYGGMEERCALVYGLLTAPAGQRRRIVGELDVLTGMHSAVLHPVLARLEQAGMVESAWEEPPAFPDGTRRRVYWGVC